MVPMVLQFPKDTWVRTRGLHDNNVTSTVAQYGWSLFRAVSQMLCIGYGPTYTNRRVCDYDNDAAWCNIICSIHWLFDICCTVPQCIQASLSRKV